MCIYVLQVFGDICLHINVIKMLVIKSSHISENGPRPIVHWQDFIYLTVTQTISR